MASSEIDCVDDPRFTDNRIRGKPPAIMQFTPLSLTSETACRHTGYIQPCSHLHSHFQRITLLEHLLNFCSPSPSMATDLVILHGDYSGGFLNGDPVPGSSSLPYIFHPPAIYISQWIANHMTPTHKYFTAHACLCSLKSQNASFSFWSDPSNSSSFTEKAVPTAPHAETGSAPSALEFSSPHHSLHQEHYLTNTLLSRSLAKIRLFYYSILDVISWVKLSQVPVLRRDCYFFLTTMTLFFF